MFAGVSLDQAPPEDIPIRFFLSAPVFGILAGLLILIDGSSLFSSTWDFETVALTHLFTLGWLAMIMFGSFYQMVPVLVGGTVPYMPFSRVVHALYSVGVLLIVWGIYSFATVALQWGLLLLILAFLFFIVQLGIALFKVEPNRPTVVAMMISLVSLAFTVLLGILFAGNYADWWSFSLDRTQMIGIHLTFGLFGWVATLIIGVGFHVIPMFYLTPTFPLDKAYRVLKLMVISLIAVPIALLIDLNGCILVAAGFPGFLGMILFVDTIYELFKQRKRKVMDTTIRFWQLGLISLPLSLVSLILYQFYPYPFFSFLFAFFFIIGFAVAITNGMLYKIVPFLVWWHRLSSLIGKVPVPMLKEISSDKTARKQWKSMTVTLVLLFVFVSINFDVAVRLTGLLLAISSAQLLWNLIKMVRIKVPEVPENNSRGF